MGEPAVKEHSMEDILSSIRKIISEEGNEAVAAEANVVASPEPVANQVNDVTDQVYVAEPEPVMVNVAPNETSGNEAAKMAASLASIAQTVKAEMPVEEEVYAEPVMAEPAVSEQNVWDEVAEPVVVEQPFVESQEPAPSLAAIAETIVEQVEVPAAPAFEVEVAEESEIHVEMAEAMPAPEQVDAPIDVPTSAVETMVEEEMAFKGALMSPSSDGAVAGAFDRLKRSAMDDIDAKTEAILRPMLREWLDENLPNMVERLVREEIERVARGV